MPVPRLAAALGAASGVHLVKVALRGAKPGREQTIRTSHSGSFIGAVRTQVGGKPRPAFLSTRSRTAALNPWQCQLISNLEGQQASVFPPGGSHGQPGLRT